VSVRGYEGIMYVYASFTGIWEKKPERSYFLLGHLDKAQELIEGK